MIDRCLHHSSSSSFVWEHLNERGSFKGIIINMGDSKQQPPKMML